MARKANKTPEAQQQQPHHPHSDEDHIMTEQESIHDDGGVDHDEQLDTPDSDGDIPAVIDKFSDGEVGNSKKAAKGTSNKKANAKQQQQQQHTKASIPFMDTFYQLSSEESLHHRSIAARDLIQHCFLSDGGVNCKDAAYALSRLMNGLCTGRAASRQGFASCLSSFLRVAHSEVLNRDGSVMDMILKEESGKFYQDGVTHPAMIVRLKLLSTTQFLPTEVNSNNDKGPKKHGFGGKVKGIEERDHAFGRLFGISAVVRSGILASTDFPSEVSADASTRDLCRIDWQL